MKFVRSRKRLFLGVAPLLLFLGIIGCGFLVPGTVAGHLTFYACYLLPPARPLFLRIYPSILTANDGGHLAPDIDEFLSERLWEPDSQEWRAILQFYTDQGPARWGRACGRLHESLKPRLARYLLSSIDSDPPETQINKLIFIEYLRLDGELYKGEFNDGTVWQPGESQRSPDFDPAKIRQAISAYRNWFASSADWAQLRATNPLEGTGMKITGIP